MVADIKGPGIIAPLNATTNEVAKIVSKDSIFQSQV
jgi:hypothetical protein